jgi:hypothetical protein
MIKTNIYCDACQKDIDKQSPHLVMGYHIVPANPPTPGSGARVSGNVHFCDQSCLQRFFAGPTAYLEEADYVHVIEKYKIYDDASPELKIFASEQKALAFIRLFHPDAADLKKGTWDIPEDQYLLYNKTKLE